MPDIDLKNEEQMTHAILKVCGEVQTFVNQMFDVMADRMFNVQKHRFDAKQEVPEVSFLSQANPVDIHPTKAKPTKRKHRLIVVTILQSIYTSKPSNPR